MRFSIVTGSSRGLGHAIVNRLLREGHHVFGISRTAEEFDSNEGAFEHFVCDLNELDRVEHVIREIFQRIAQTAAEIDGLYLINNAATLTPLGPIETSKSADIIRHFHVNLLAPVVLTARFIECSKNFLVDKRVLNISSSSAKYPVPEMGCYCASKSALDTFTRSIGQESKDDPWPVQAISVYPGMVDSDMQSQAREQHDFALTELFRDAKEAGRLHRPKHIAEQVVELMFDSKIRSGDIIDLERTFE